MFLLINCFYKLLYCIPGPMPSRQGITTSTYLITYDQTLTKQMSLNDFTHSSRCFMSGLFLNWFYILILTLEVNSLSLCNDNSLHLTLCFHI